MQIHRTFKGDMAKRAGWGEHNIPPGTVSSSSSRASASRPSTPPAMSPTNSSPRRTTSTRRRSMQMPTATSCRKTWRRSTWRRSRRASTGTRSTDGTLAARTVARLYQKQPCPVPRPGRCGRTCGNCWRHAQLKSVEIWSCWLSEIQKYVPCDARIRISRSVTKFRE